MGLFPATRLRHKAAALLSASPFVNSTKYEVMTVEIWVLLLLLLLFYYGVMVHNYVQIFEQKTNTKNSESVI